MFRSLVSSMRVNPHRAVMVKPKHSYARQVVMEHCRAFSPLMQIGDHLVNARFDKWEISRVNGHVVAYYTGQTRIHGVRFIQTARYRVSDGSFHLEHIFPLRAK